MTVGKIFGIILLAVVVASMAIAMFMAPHSVNSAIAAVIQNPVARPMVALVLLFAVGWLLSR